MTKLQSTQGYLLYEYCYMSYAYNQRNRDIFQDTVARMYSFLLARLEHFCHYLFRRTTLNHWHYTPNPKLHHDQ